MSNKVFSIKHLKELVDSKRFDESNEYINKFFFKYGPDIYFFNGYKCEFQLLRDTEAYKLLPDDLVIYDKKVEIYNAKKYLKSSQFKMKEYNPTIDFNNDNITFEKTNRNGIPVNYVNMAKPLPSYEQIEANREELKEQLEMVYNHIKTVWANNDNNIFEWILNFLSCSITGKRKLRQCLYLPCNEERAGRGSILNFVNNIIGDRMYKTCSTEELLKYNKNFEGRSLINFDELPTDMGNFKSVSDTLKALITEPTFPCRDMYNKPYNQKNTFNIIITSNNEAVRITQSNNARYMICNINTCYVGDYPYFKKLNDILRKEEIQKLFYEDMVKRYDDIADTWNEDIKPESQLKNEKLLESLPWILKYIKEEFVLKGLDLDMTTSDFFTLYYSNSKDKTSKQKLNKEMLKVGIKPIKAKIDGKGYYVYRISHEQLLENYRNKKFIDEELENINIEDNEIKENSSLDADLIIKDLTKENKDLKSKIEELQKQLEALQKQQVEEVDEEYDVDAAIEEIKNLLD